jgi:hypothetical protein
MRFLARFIGLVALAGAFAAAVIDGARSIAAGVFAPTSSGAALYWVSPKALASLQALVESRFGQWAWDGVLVRMLLAPAFVSLAALSALLFLISRRRPPEIGRSSRDR